MKQSKVDQLLSLIKSIRQEDFEGHGGIMILGHIPTESGCVQLNFAAGPGHDLKAIVAEACAEKKEFYEILKQGVMGFQNHGQAIKEHMAGRDTTSGKVNRREEYQRDRMEELRKEAGMPEMRKGESMRQYFNRIKESMSKEEREITEGLLGLFEHLENSHS